MIHSAAVAACLLLCLAQPAQAATSNFDPTSDIGSCYSAMASTMAEGKMDCSCHEKTDSYTGYMLYYGECTDKAIDTNALECAPPLEKACVVNHCTCKVPSTTSGTNSGSRYPSQTQHLRGNRNRGGAAVGSTIVTTSNAISYDGGQSWVDIPESDQQRINQQHFK